MRGAEEEAGVIDAGTLHPFQQFFQTDEPLLADDKVVDQFDVEDVARLHDTSLRFHKKQLVSLPITTKQEFFYQRLGEIALVTKELAKEAAH